MTWVLCPKASFFPLKVQMRKVSTSWDCVEINTQACKVPPWEMLKAGPHDAEDGPILQDPDTCSVTISLAFQMDTALLTYWHYLISIGCLCLPLPVYCLLF